MSEDAELPATLSLDEAYRAAFYLVLQYLELEKEPDDALVVLGMYLWTDPARWAGWLRAVGRALGDGGAANPNHDGIWELRPDWPKLS
jgi:hypothetical protein